MFCRFLIIACFIGFLGFETTPSFAAAKKPEQIIRIVNVQEIMKQSTAVQGLNKQLNAYRKKYDAEFIKMEKTLQKEDRELVKQKTLLTKDAYQQQVKDFRTKFTKFQKSLRLRQQQLDTAYKIALSKVSHQIKKIWLEVANKEHATLVLRSSEVLMFSPDFDVTDDVVARLNKALPSINLPNPEKIGSKKKTK